MISIMAWGYARRIEESQQKNLKPKAFDKICERYDKARSYGVEPLFAEMGDIVEYATPSQVKKFMEESGFLLDRGPADGFWLNEWKLYRKKLEDEHGAKSEEYVRIHGLASTKHPCPFPSPDDDEKYKSYEIFRGEKNKRGEHITYHPLFNEYKKPKLPTQSEGQIPVEKWGL